jgi:hypothetical protein
LEKLLSGRGCGISIVGTIFHLHLELRRRSAGLNGGGLKGTRNGEETKGKGNELHD